MSAVKQFDNQDEVDGKFDESCITSQLDELLPPVLCEEPEIKAAGTCAQCASARCLSPRSRAPTQQRRGSTCGARTPDLHKHSQYSEEAHDRRARARAGHKGYRRRDGEGKGAGVRRKGEESNCEKCLLLWRHT